MPIQQVGRVIAQGAELTDEQTALVERVIPITAIRESYQPSSPDYIKKHPQFNVQAFDENKGALLGLWLQLMPQHFEEYTNAWLLQTIGYWKYDFPPHAAHLEDSPPDAFGVENKDVVLKVTGINLRDFFLSRTEFLSMGWMALFVLFSATHLVATRRSRLVLCLVPLLTVWLGLMLGAPTYRDLRYMLVFALALPLLFFLLFAKTEKATVPNETPNEQGNAALQTTTLP